MQPSNITSGNLMLARNWERKLVWAAIGDVDVEAILSPKTPPSPWMLPPAEWPARNFERPWRVSEWGWSGEGESGGVEGEGEEEMVLEPRTPTAYEIFLLEGRGDMVPWLQPSVTVEFGWTRYSVVSQPRSEKAREDELPISPGKGV